MRIGTWAILLVWLPREKEPISGILCQVWDGLPKGNYINAMGMGSTSDNHRQTDAASGTIGGRHRTGSLRFDQQTGCSLPRRPTALVYP